MTILNKFIKRVLEEPTDNLGLPILHEIALRKKVSKAKLKRITNILHKYGMSKDCYLRIHQCDVCKEQYKWKNAYHLELAYKDRLHSYFENVKWDNFTVEKINRLTDEKVIFNIDINRFKKIVKTLDIIDANVTSSHIRKCFVFANDNFKYIIDGSVVDG